MRKKIDKLCFGTAGIPHSAKKKDSIEGIKTIRELNLDAMELEFVRGVKMSEGKAEKVREVSEENNVILTAHAPYYINLLSTNKKTYENSIRNIYLSAKILNIAGGWSVVFHPGYYKDLVKQAAYSRMREAMKEIIKLIEDENIDVWIRPETMEMQSKFGDVDEVLSLSEEFEKVMPCIDFAHIRYRYNANTKEFFRSILEKVENKLGKEGLENMHIHMSGIKLDSKGTHVNLPESDLVWKEILDLLKEFKVKGVLISESPNLEEDAILMKNYYLSIK